MTHLLRAVIASLAVLGLPACLSLGGSNSRGGPRATVGDARLLDLPATYRSMGLLAAGPPLPFVASFRFLAAGSPDSTLVILGVSLPNQALQFLRDGNTFAAAYHVEVSLAGEAGVVEVSSDEQVRVASFQETVRDDESVIFQRFFTAVPGTYVVRIVLRDRGGPGFTEASDTIDVPTIPGHAALAPPVPVYAVTPRDSASRTPRLIVNPRATVAYGVDTLRLYVEGYHLPRGAQARVEATDPAGAVVWRDAVTFNGGEAIESRLVRIPPDRLPVGRVHVATELSPDGPRHMSQVLIGFSDQWVTASLEEMLSLLRYFEHEALLDSIRTTPSELKSAAWRRFWERTDPDSGTPANEALDTYFRRLTVANRRFIEPGEPGWLTDRGRVFITLGDPDEIAEQRGDIGRRDPRAIQWRYREYQLALIFVDETGFGRFRLTPASHSEYLRILERVRG